MPFGRVTGQEETVFLARVAAENSAAIVAEGLDTTPPFPEIVHAVSSSKSKSHAEKRAPKNINLRVGINPTTKLTNN